jgi:hypothetical protein
MLCQFGHQCRPAYTYNFGLKNTAEDPPLYALCIGLALQFG